MSGFIFKAYSYDTAQKQARFTYHNGGIDFTETITFKQTIENYNTEAFERALFLAFVLIGTSYYKTFPSRTVELKVGDLDEWQAKFFNSVYQEGLSQFAFENKLTRADLAVFTASSKENTQAVVEYQSTDSSPLVMQSGGKDSLLLAELIKSKANNFSTWFLQTSTTYPLVLEEINQPLITAKRTLDKEGLAKARQEGALNGHVPVTYIVEAIALLQAILSGKDTVLAAIGHEGEEPYGYIDDLPVAHQWAKTWLAEMQFNEYIQRYISPKLRVGSPLRKYSELKIAQMFVELCWEKYSREFSSCNIGNYKQGQDNQHLGWCGNCPKCANSFLLFAPFVEPSELLTVFNGENLFKKPSLTEIFKGLLGIDNAVKPFECIGEEAELRMAYKMAQQKSPEYELPFEVPDSDFNYQTEYPVQSWTTSYS